MTVAHQPGCEHARKTVSSAYRSGCRCPEVVTETKRYRAERRQARAEAIAAGARSKNDVDIRDVKAAIVTYADRGLPVPETMTVAERKLVAEWLDRERRGTGADAIARITRLSDQTITRMRARRRVGAAA